jgi:hypothetical protein
MSHLDRTGYGLSVIMVAGMIRGLDLDLDVTIFEYTVRIEREHQQVRSVIVFDSLTRETTLENEPFDMIHAQVREYVFTRAAFLPPHGLLSRSQLPSEACHQLSTLPRFASPGQGRLGAVNAGAALHLQEQP